MEKGKGITVTAEFMQNSVMAVIGIIVFGVLAWGFLSGEFERREQNRLRCESAARDAAREWYDNEYAPAMRDGREPRTQREYFDAKTNGAVAVGNGAE